MEFMIVVVMWLLVGVVIFGSFCLNLAWHYWMFGSNPESGFRHSCQLTEVHMSPNATLEIFVPHLKKRQKCA